MSMIERVAEALAEADLFKWNTFDEIERQAYLGQARAAIEAMREPTPEIYQAINNHNAEQWFDPEDLWKSAINAALEEGVT